MPTATKKRNNIARYNRFNPRRLPHWRFDRIRSLLDNNETGGRARPNPAEDDEFITLGFQFLKRWEAVNKLDLSPEDLERHRQMELMGDNPGLYFAYEMYTSPKEDKLRNHTEAHILAGRVDSEISEITDQDIDSIMWYEKIFFNVREKLETPSYIDAQVLAKAVNCGLANLNLRLMVKFWAYYGGPYMLDAFINGMPRQFAKPGPNTDYQKVLTNTQNLDLIKYSTDATKALGPGDVNTYNYFDLVNAHNQIVSLVEASKADSGNTTPLEETVSAVLTGLNWAVGASRTQILAGSPLGPFMGHSAEPRADDQLRIAAGLSVDYTSEELASRTLPPPRPKEKQDAATVKQES